MYQVRVLDRSRELVAILDTTNWRYSKRRNEATTVAAADLPREELEEYISEYSMLSETQPTFNEGQDTRFQVDENKMQYANIAYYLQLWKEDDLMVSSVITNRDIADNTVSIEALTEEILLERAQTPVQYDAVLEGLDLADATRKLIDNWHSERVKDQTEWEENIDSNNIDTETEPGIVILDQVALNEPYFESGYIVFRFESTDYPNFKSWDRIRWAADNEEPVRTTMQYRYGTEGDLTDWTPEVEGALPDKLGVVPAATDEPIIDIRINLYTDDRESEDPEGNEIGVTPALYAVEMIARTESEIEEGNIPSSTGKIVNDVDADSQNKLDVLVDMCEQTGYEFEINEGELDIAESFGEDRTDDFILRNGTNINITALGDDDEELVNVLKAQGPGDGINRLEKILRDEQSIQEYGEYPATEEFDVDDISELETEAQNYLDEHNSPAQIFEVNALFEEEPEYGYGDKVKVADPRTNIITTAKIDEIRKRYDAGGLNVRLDLNKARRGLVDAALDPRATRKRFIPKPSISTRSRVDGIEITSHFSDFDEWDFTEYHVSKAQDFDPQPSTLKKAEKSKKVQISGLDAEERYYCKCINRDEKGNSSEVSQEKSVIAGFTEDSSLPVPPTPVFIEEKTGGIIKGFKATLEKPTTRGWAGFEIHAHTEDFDIYDTDVIETLYDEGEGEDDWVEGYSIGNGNQSKEEDYLYLFASDESGSAERTYVTDEKIDLTNITEIKISWENEGAFSMFPQSVIAVSKEKEGNSKTYALKETNFGFFTQQEDILDVTDLAGEYYIRVHAVDTDESTSRDSELKVHGVSLLEKIYNDEYLVDRGNKTKFEVTDLEPDTDYYVKAVSYNQAGDFSEEGF